MRIPFNKLQPIDPELLKAPSLEDQRATVLNDLFIKDEDRVPIRILASESLNLRAENSSLLRRVISQGKNVIARTAPNDDTAIIIHIHGGGFVSMSSQAHKMYLNRWVKNLKLVHFFY